MLLVDQACLVSAQPLLLSILDRRPRHLESKPVDFFKVAYRRDIRPTRSRSRLGDIIGYHVAPQQKHLVSSPRKKTVTTSLVDLEHSLVSTMY